MPRRPNAAGPSPRAAKAMHPPFTYATIEHIVRTARARLANAAPPNKKGLNFSTRMRHVSSLGAQMAVHVCSRRRAFISLSGRVALGLPLLSVGACSRDAAPSASKGDER
jgi:hypothetical protein